MQVWKRERERDISSMREMLKIITCGSVDDGKSTLIGNILYNAKLLHCDQEAALKENITQEGELNYSLL